MELPTSEMGSYRWLFSETVDVLVVRPQLISRVCSPPPGKYISWIGLAAAGAEKAKLGNVVADVHAIF